jgi:TolB-like protein
MKYLVPLILAAALSAQTAPKTAVFTFSTVGVDEATAQTATSIFRSELGNTGKFVVIDADAMKATLGNDNPVEGVAAAVENARTLGAEKAVVGSMNKLGAQTLVEVKLVNVTTEAVEFSDRLGTASGADLEVVLVRLAKGMAERKKASQTAEVGTVTEKEGIEPARRASFWTGGGRIGYLFPFGGFGSSPGLPLGFAVSGLYETPSFMAEAGYEFYTVTGNASLWRAGFSGFKMMTKTDVCPYLGGGVGFGVASSSNLQSVGVGVGPILNLGGGVMFLRTYDFRIVADLRYYLSFCDIEGGTGSSFQHGPALSVGLYYKRSKTEGSRGCCCGLGLF